MIDVLRFWLIVQLFALAALPLAWRLLGALPSRGYVLAKPLGLLLVTYLLWMGASLGLLRNNVGGILLCWLLVLILSLWVGRDGWRRSVSASTQEAGRPLFAWLRVQWRLVVVTEVLFLLALGFWAFVRSYSPEITTAGGEKFMELTFLNGILRSDRFPPLDPWLSGYAISYYYFGYIMLAALTQLSGLAPSVAFNVGLATWFALTLTTAFGVTFDLVAALVRSPSVRGPLEQARQRADSGAALAGGLLGALFVAVVSNLEGFLESMQGIGLGSLAFWRWLDIKDLNCLDGPAYTVQVANCPQASGIMPERFFWWWRASRVITDRDLLGNAVEIIDEFPFFSFLLGDMHPHVLGLPFVLLAVGLALALLLGVRDRAAGGKWQVARSSAAERNGAGARSWVAGWVGLFPLGWVGIVVYALCLGGLGFLNTWDFPIYLFLIMLVMGVRLAWEQGGLSWGVAGRAMAGAVALGLLGALLYLPFYAGFQSQAGGILPNFLFGTRLSQFFVMFGPLLVAVLFLLIALSTRGRFSPKSFVGFFAASILLPIAFLILVLVVGLLTPGGQELISRLRDLPMVQQSGAANFGQLALEVAKVRLGSPWTYLFLAALIAWVLALLAKRLSSSADLHSAPLRDFVPPADLPPATLPPVTFALLALLTALLLVFSVEFVYLRDTFGTRMNTVFKFYFQAWVLMAVVAAFAVVYLAKYAGRALRWVSLPVIALVAIAGLFYPAFGTITRAERFKSTPTLDGTAYLAPQNAGDAAAIAWLRQNVPGVAIILEASGGSYSYAGRISAQTGLPTLLGWDGHELQWRGNTIEQDKRRPDIERIYRYATGNELRQLLDRWQIDYLIVGDLERQTFGVTPQSEARLAQVMELVYDAEGVRIYRRRG